VVGLFFVILLVGVSYQHCPFRALLFAFLVNNYICITQKIQMKIATLNIDWFKKSKAIQTLIKEEIIKQDVDFLVVTENIQSFHFDDKYFAYHSTPIPTIGKFQYLNYGEYLKGETPVRATIYSKHKSTEQLNVVDAYTSICHKFLVDEKEIVIYGTIIGTFGIIKQKEIAQPELDNFKTDIQNISLTNENIFIAGDLNTSFIPIERLQLASIKSRDKIVDFTNSLHIQRKTEAIKNNIDHIFVSQKLNQQTKVEPFTFLDDNALKDAPHKGILLDINFIH
jgi:endonuclease/exonuclease/phosphatase (EEP) superfamily protein YafD